MSENEVMNVEEGVVEAVENNATVLGTIGKVAVIGAVIAGGVVAYRYIHRKIAEKKANEPETIEAKETNSKKSEKTEK